MRCHILVDKILDKIYKSEGIMIIGNISRNVIHLHYKKIPEKKENYCLVGGSI